MDQANMDFYYQGSANGSVAQRLLANAMDPRALRPWEEKGKCFITVMQGGEAIARPVANATLRKDEWVHYDTAVVEAAKQRLNFVNFLNARGLNYNLSNGLASTVLQYEKLSDISDAELTMDGANRGRGDRPVWTLGYLPLPLVHKDFEVNARSLEASRTTGDPLDTTMAAMAGRKVAEKIEEMAVIGASGYAFGGGTIRGVIDFADRNTYSLSCDWADIGDSSLSTGPMILDDVLGMIQAARDDRMYGPYVLLVPGNFETALDADYVANYPKTVRERIMAIDSIADVLVVDKLTASNVALVQLSTETIRMVNGMAVTVVQWADEGGMIFRFKVMAIQVPQPRSDDQQRCGIVHAS